MNRIAPCLALTQTRSREPRRRSSGAARPCRGAAAAGSCRVLAPGDASVRFIAAEDRRRAVAKERAMFRDALAGPFEIPVYFDYPATFIWALSGALLAARLRLDPTGVATSPW